MGAGLVNREGFEKMVTEGFITSYRIELQHRVVYVRINETVEDRDKYWFEKIKRRKF